MKQRSQHQLSSSLYTLGIVTLFLGGFLLLVVFGAASYRNITLSQSENNHVRELQSYLLTTIQSNKLNKMYLKEAEEADSKVLYIEDIDSTYGFRIYNYQGNLVEDYGEMNGKLYPKDANVLGENSTLNFELVNPELLKITTDLGSIYVKVYRFEKGQ